MKVLYIFIIFIGYLQQRISTVPELGREPSDERL